MRLAGVPTVLNDTGGCQTAILDDPNGALSVAAFEPADDRPVIVYRQRLAETVDRAEAALVANPGHNLYVRGDRIVRVVHDGAFGGSRLDRPGGARAAVVTADLLREWLDRSAHWFREGKSGPVPALPPVWVATTLLSRSRWGLLQLEGISSTPVLRPDGTVCEAPGYDLLTGVYFDPGATRFPPMVPHPSLDDAIVAWKALRALFVDFPFVHESDFSALLATILTILGRNLIPGPCPMTAIRSPMPGAGKGLCADAVSVIGLGQVVPRTSRPRDDDEMRKHILPIGIEARSLVLLDNVNGSFGSPSIAAALTSTTFSDRLLGVSQTVTVPMRTVWMLTGKNTSFREDLGRRVVLCDLDPRCEHPEDRTDFRYPNLLEHLLEERPRLVTAALTILRAYVLEGMPSHGKPRKGSFEAWDDLVRGSLIWLGAPDPLEGQIRLRETGDAELEALRDFLLQWWAKLGPNAWTLASLLRETASDEEFRAALVEVACTDPAHLSSHRLGYVFRGIAGRIAAGLRLEKDPGLTAGAARWRVVREEAASGDGGDSGDESPPAKS